MSIAATKCVLKFSRHDAVRKLVLVGCADHANEHGQRIFPGVKRLADYANIHERSVKRHLKELVKDGTLEVVRQGGGRHNSTEYSLKKWMVLQQERVTELCHRKNSETVTDCHPLDRETVTPVAKRVTPVVRNGDTAMSPQPSITTSNRHRETGTALAARRIPVATAAGKAAIPPYEKFHTEAKRLVPQWTEARIGKLYQTCERAIPRDWKQWLNRCAVNHMQDVAKQQGTQKQKQRKLPK